MDPPVDGTVDLPKVAIVKIHGKANLQFKVERQTTLSTPVVVDSRLSWGSGKEIDDQTPSHFVNSLGSTKNGSFTYVRALALTCCKHSDFLYEQSPFRVSDIMKAANRTGLVNFFRLLGGPETKPKTCLSTFGDSPEIIDAVHWFLMLPLKKSSSEEFPSAISVSQKFHALLYYLKPKLLEPDTNAFYVAHVIAACVALEHVALEASLSLTTRNTAPSKRGRKGSASRTPKGAPARTLDAGSDSDSESKFDPEPVDGAIPSKETSEEVAEFAILDELKTLINYHNDVQKREPVVTTEDYKKRFNTSKKNIKAVMKRFFSAYEQLKDLRDARIAKPTDETTKLEFLKLSSTLKDAAVPIRKAIDAYRASVTQDFMVVLNPRDEDDEVYNTDSEGFQSEEVESESDYENAVARGSKHKSAKKATTAPKKRPRSSNETKEGAGEMRGAASGVVNGPDEPQKKTKGSSSKRPPTMDIDALWAEEPLDQEPLEIDTTTNDLNEVFETAYLSFLPASCKSLIPEANLLIEKHKEDELIELIRGVISKDYENKKDFSDHVSARFEIMKDKEYKFKFLEDGPLVIADFANHLVFIFPKTTSEGEEEEVKVLFSDYIKDCFNGDRALNDELGNAVSKREYTKKSITREFGFTKLGMLFAPVNVVSTMQLISAKTNAPCYGILLFFKDEQFLFGKRLRADDGVCTTNGSCECTAVYGQSDGFRIDIESSSILTCPDDFVVNPDGTSQRLFLTYVCLINIKSEHVEVFTKKDVGRNRIIQFDPTEVKITSNNPYNTDVFIDDPTSIETTIEGSGEEWSEYAFKLECKLKNTWCSDETSDALALPEETSAPLVTHSIIHTPEHPWGVENSGVNRVFMVYDDIEDEKQYALDKALKLETVTPEALRDAMATLLREMADLREFQLSTKADNAGYSLFQRLSLYPKLFELTDVLRDRPHRTPRSLNRIDNQVQIVGATAGTWAVVSTNGPTQTIQPPKFKMHDDVNKYATVNPAQVFVGVSAASAMAKEHLYPCFGGKPVTPIKDSGCQRVLAQLLRSAIGVPPTTELTISKLDVSTDMHLLSSGLFARSAWPAYIAAVTLLKTLFPQSTTLPSEPVIDVDSLRPSKSHALLFAALQNQIHVDALSSAPSGSLQSCCLYPGTARRLFESWSDEPSFTVEMLTELEISIATDQDASIVALMAVGCIPVTNLVHIDPSVFPVGLTFNSNLCATALVPLLSVPRKHPHVVSMLQSDMSLSKVVPVPFDVLCSDSMLVAWTRSLAQPGTENIDTIRKFLLTTMKTFVEAMGPSGHEFVGVDSKCGKLCLLQDSFTETCTKELAHDKEYNGVYKYGRYARAFNAHLTILWALGNGKKIQFENMDNARNLVDAGFPLVNLPEVRSELAPLSSWTTHLKFVVWSTRNADPTAVQTNDWCKSVKECINNVAKSNERRVPAPWRVPRIPTTPSCFPPHPYYLISEEEATNTRTVLESRATKTSIFAHPATEDVPSRQRKWYTVHLDAIFNACNAHFRTVEEVIKRKHLAKSPKWDKYVKFLCLNVCNVTLKRVIETQAATDLKSKTPDSSLLFTEEHTILLDMAKLHIISNMCNILNPALPSTLYTTWRCLNEELSTFNTKKTGLTIQEIPDAVVAHSGILPGFKVVSFLSAWVPDTFPCSAAFSLTRTVHVQTSSIENARRQSNPENSLESIKCFLDSFDCAPVINSREAQEIWASFDCQNRRRVQWGAAWPLVPTTPVSNVRWQRQAVTLSVVGDMPLSQSDKIPAVLVATRAIGDFRGYVAMSLTGDWIFATLASDSGTTSVFGRSTQDQNEIFEDCDAPSFNLYTSDTIVKPDTAFGTLNIFNEVSDQHQFKAYLFSNSFVSDTKFKFQKARETSRLVEMVVDEILCHPDFFGLVKAMTTTKLLHVSGNVADGSLAATLLGGCLMVKSSYDKPDKTCKPLGSVLMDPSISGAWAKLESICDTTMPTDGAGVGAAAGSSTDPQPQPSKVSLVDLYFNTKHKDVVTKTLWKTLETVPPFGPYPPDVSPLEILKEDVNARLKLAKSIQVAPFSSLLTLISMLNTSEKNPENDQRVLLHPIQTIFRDCNLPLLVNVKGKVASNAPTQMFAGTLVIRDYLKAAMLPEEWADLKFNISTSKMPYMSIPRELVDGTRIIVPIRLNVDEKDFPVQENFDIYELRNRRNCNVIIQVNTHGYSLLRNSDDTSKESVTSPWKTMFTNDPKKRLYELVGPWATAIPRLYTVPDKAHPTPQDLAMLATRPPRLMLSTTAILVFARKTYAYLTIPQAPVAGTLADGSGFYGDKLLDVALSMDMKMDDKLCDIQTIRRLTLDKAVTRDGFSDLFKNTVKYGLSCALAMTNPLGFSRYIKTSDNCTYDPLFFSYCTPPEWTVPETKPLTRVEHESVMWNSKHPIHISECFGVMRPALHLFWAQSIIGLFDSIEMFVDCPKEGRKGLDSKFREIFYQSHGIELESKPKTKSSGPKEDISEPEIFTSLNKAFKFVLKTFGEDRGKIILCLVSRAIVAGAKSCASIPPRSSSTQTKFGTLLKKLSQRFKSMDLMCTTYLEDVDLADESSSAITSSKESLTLKRDTLKQNFKTKAEEYIQKKWESIPKKYRGNKKFSEISIHEKEVIIDWLRKSKQVKTKTTLGQVWSMLQSRPSPIEELGLRNIFEARMEFLFKFGDTPLRWKNNIEKYLESESEKVTNEFFLDGISRKDAMLRNWKRNVIDDIEATLNAGMLCLTHWITEVSHGSQTCSVFMPAVAAIVESMFTIGRFARWTEHVKEDDKFVDPLEGKTKCATKAAKKLTKVICELLCKGTTLIFDPMVMLHSAERIASHLYIDKHDIRVTCPTQESTPPKTTSTEKPEPKTIPLFAHSISASIITKTASTDASGGAGAGAGAGAGEAPSTSVVISDRFVIDNGGWIGYSPNPITHVKVGEKKTLKMSTQLPVWHGGRPTQPRDQEGETILETGNAVYKMLVPMTKLMHKNAKKECRDDRTLSFSMAATFAYQIYHPSIPREQSKVENITLVNKDKRIEPTKEVKQTLVRHPPVQAQHAHCNSSANALSRVFATAVMGLSPDM